MGSGSSKSKDIKERYYELFLNREPSKESERIAFMDTYDTILQCTLIKLTGYTELTYSNGLYGIHFASQDNHCEVVRRFLDMGVNVNIKDNGDLTPLHIASTYECDDTVELLLQKGADPNVSDIYGNRPLHNASINGCENTIELLLKSGANPNVSDNDGFTPLHDALHGNVKCGKLLAYDKPKFKSIISYNYHRIVELLLKSGANPNVSNVYGDTPYMLAKRCDDLRIVTLLDSYCNSDVGRYPVVVQDLPPSYESVVSECPTYEC